MFVRMAARIVSAAQARALLPMAEAIDANARAFQLFHQGGVLNPDRVIVRAHICDEFLHPMLGWCRPPSVLPSCTTSCVFVLWSRLGRCASQLTADLQIWAHVWFRCLRGPPQMEVKAPGSPTTGHTLFKPAYIRESGALGLKVVSVFPSNAAIGLPTVPGTILVLDPHTGMLRGLVDGTYVTALRTAAGSGAATRVLARADAGRVLVFGAGAQASAHISAMLCVRPVSSVTVVCRNPAAGAELVARARAERGGDVTWTVIPADDAPAVQAAVSASDIICTCTSSATPLFDGSWVTAGTHINAVGSYRPDCAELDAVCVSRCRIITDTAAAEECGEIHGGLATRGISRDSHLVGTLGELLCGAVAADKLAPTASQVHCRDCAPIVFLSCQCTFVCVMPPPPHTGRTSHCSSRWGWRFKTWPPRVPS